MDNETIKALRGCAEFVDGGAGDVTVQCVHLRALLDAYESLQRIAVLVDTWRDRRDRCRATAKMDRIDHGEAQARLMEDRADAFANRADELQQALPEGMRNT